MLSSEPLQARSQHETILRHYPRFSYRWNSLCFILSSRSWLIASDFATVRGP